MAKSQNDKIILNLKNEIEIKKKSLNKAKKFSPITNCSIELFEKRFNLNVLDKSQLLYLISHLNALKSSLYSLYPNETLMISSFSIDEWLTDLQSKFEYLNIKIEEDRLKTLEDKLHNLLSVDTKVGLEIEGLKKLI